MCISQWKEEGERKKKGREKEYPAIGENSLRFHFPITNVSYRKGSIYIV